MTNSGLYGFVTNTDGNTVTVKIAEGVKVEMDRNAIASIVSRKDSEGSTEVSAK